MNLKYPPCLHIIPGFPIICLRETLSKIENGLVCLFTLTWGPFAFIVYLKIFIRLWTRIPKQGVGSGNAALVLALTGAPHGLEGVGTITVGALGSSGGAGKRVCPSVVGVGHVDGLSSGAGEVQGSPLAGTISNSCFIEQ